MDIRSGGVETIAPHPSGMMQNTFLYQFKQPTCSIDCFIPSKRKLLIESSSPSPSPSIAITVPVIIFIFIRFIILYCIRVCVCACMCRPIAPNWWYNPHYHFV